MKNKHIFNIIKYLSVGAMILTQGMLAAQEIVNEFFIHSISGNSLPFKLWHEKG